MVTTRDANLRHTASAPGAVNLSTMASTLRRRWLVVVLFLLAGLVAGAANASATTPRYKAQTTLFFALSQAQTATELAQGSTYTQALVQSYVRVITSPVVLAPVIEQLGLAVTPGQLAASVSAKSPLNTVLIDVSVTDTSAEQAAAIARAIASQTATVLASLSPRGTSDDTLKVTVIAPAVTPKAPTTPRPHLDEAIGLVAGALLGYVVVLLQEILVGHLNDREAVARVTTVPVIASLPRVHRRLGTGPGRGSRQAASLSAARVEASRSLRTNLDFLRRGSGAQQLVITSANALEGKTTTVIDLARVLAQSRLRVLLVDADLRRPSIARQLGLEGTVGLSTVLAGKASFTDAIQPWGSDELHVMASGIIPPNPSELLASAEMGEVLAAAGASYDVVLYDCAPVLPVTDAAILAARADGALMIVNVRSTKHRHLSEALGLMAMSGASVLGIALNATRAAKSSYYAASKAGRGPRTGATQATVAA